MVAPDLLIPKAPHIHAITTPDGAFSIPEVPAWAPTVQAKSRVKNNEAAREGVSGSTQTIHGGVTYAGTIVLEKAQ